MSDIADPPLTTLWQPFHDGLLPWPSNALLLNARHGEALRHLPTTLLCEQSFKPEVDALMQQGTSVQQLADITPGHVVTLLLPPRQRAHARASLARAVALTAVTGHVVVCASNNEGARSSQADLTQLVGQVHSLSKHKCRVFWSESLTKVDTALLQSWLTLDAVQPIDARFVSRPGVFAWDRIDPASALLASHLPAQVPGRAADLGAGFGYLAAELLARCAGITALDIYEADGRALELARHNLAGHHQPIEYHWHDVTRGLLNRYALIVSNPPFHTQRADRPELGQEFIRAAAAALLPGGQLWLVANRHLPYESVLNDGFGSTRLVAQQDGFKIIVATKALHIKKTARGAR